jgi:hypothetical protein
MAIINQITMELEIRSAPLQAVISRQRLTVESRPDGLKSSLADLTMHQPLFGHDIARLAQPSYRGLPTETSGRKASDRRPPGTVLKFQHTKLIPAQCTPSSRRNRTAPPT